MCCQCGNVYYQAGYKIVQVPVPGAAPTPSPFEVKPAITQEPAASTRDQHLLCEAYFHNEAIPENRALNINPLVGDVQLRAFTSFLLNQITWQNDFTTVSNNEDKRSIWIRPEPQRAGIFIAQYRTFLRKKGMTELV